MIIEYTLPFRRAPARTTLLSEPQVDRLGRPPRIARLIALAHKLDKLVGSGVVSDYGALARLGHISPARLTQMMVLLQLSPAIQEYVLFLPAADARFVTELTLRTIAREPHWDRQGSMFDQLLRVEA
jgi:hypothetical protein